MLQEIKYQIKKSLALVGFRNPALGAKMDLEGKAKLILEHKNPELEILVETGTEFGTLIEKIGDNFRKIYSIELDKELYEKAQVLFKGKKNIKLFQGDSAVVIREVLAELDKPALFWLDAHGPGAMSVKNPLHCPVEKELQAIFGHPIKEHVILIDDARHFDLDSISVIKKLVRANGFTFSVKDGIFILTRDSVSSHFL